MFANLMIKNRMDVLHALETKKQISAEIFIKTFESIYSKATECLSTVLLKYWCIL